VTPRQRTAIAALVLSASGLVGIALDEGYTPQAVIPVKGDVPTIGFGTTYGVKMGDTTTPPKALARTMVDIEKTDSQIRRCVKVPLYQFEFDSMTSLAYNIGTKAFCASTVVKRLNKQDYAGACQAILLFKRANRYDCSLPGNARICGGVWKRRQKEYRQCLGETQ